MRTGILVLSRSIGLGDDLARLASQPAKFHTPQSGQRLAGYVGNPSVIVVTRKIQRKAAITPSIAKPSAKLATCRLSRTYPVIGE